VESDVKNLRLVAFRPIAKTEVVALVRPSAETVEHLRSVKLRLFHEEKPDQSIHIARLDSIVGSQGSKVSEFYPAGVIVHFPLIPADGRGYTLQLESSLSPSAYEYSSEAITFRANVSYHYIPFVFEPIPRFVDQDMNQGSVFLLPLLIVALISYFGWDHIIPLIKNLSQKGLIRKITGDSSAGDRSNSREKTSSREKSNLREHDNSPDNSDGATVEAVGKKKKARRT
jgi:hypothetical protein